MAVAAAKEEQLRHLVFAAEAADKLQISAPAQMCPQTALSRLLDR